MGEPRESREGLLSMGEKCLLDGYWRSCEEVSRAPDDAMFPEIGPSGSCLVDAVANRLPKDALFPDCGWEASQFTRFGGNITGCWQRGGSGSVCGSW